MPHQYSQCFDFISGTDNHGRYKRQTGSNTACNVYPIADYRWDEQHVPHQYSQCFDFISGSDDHGRYNRQTGSNTACAVYAIADYRNFQHMGQSNTFPINTLSALI